MSETAPSCDLTVTPEMVRAASEVHWIQDYRFEFGVDDDAQMAKEIHLLLMAIFPRMPDPT